MKKSGLGIRTCPRCGHQEDIFERQRNLPLSGKCACGIDGEFRWHNDLPCGYVCDKCWKGLLEDYHRR